MSEIVLRQRSFNALIFFFASREEVLNRSRRRTSSGYHVACVLNFSKTKKNAFCSSWGCSIFLCELKTQTQWLSLPNCCSNFEIASTFLSELTRRRRGCGDTHALVRVALFLAVNGRPRLRGGSSNRRSPLCERSSFARAQGSGWMRHVCLLQERTQSCLTHCQARLGFHCQARRGPLIC